MSPSAGDFLAAALAETGAPPRRLRVLITAAAPLVVAVDACGAMALEGLRFGAIVLPKLVALPAVLGAGRLAVLLGVDGLPFLGVLTVDMAAEQHERSCSPRT